jgi:hypothetical protein
VDDLPRTLQRLKAGEQVKVTLTLLIRNSNFIASRSAVVNLTAR